MALLTWGEEYSVGVKEINGQHSGLFDILNKLHDAMAKGQGQSVAGELLHKLVRYTKEHFAAEERLMEAAKYPGLAKHRMQHEALARQVGELMAKYEKGEVSVNVHLLFFLRDWLKNHIQREDKEYGPWLNEHGVR